MRRIALATLLVGAAPAAAQQGGFDHRIGVVSESGDVITWVLPGPGGLTVQKTVPIGVMPADIDGPHNIAAAPDGQSYYVTIAHGTPYGTLWRLDARTDRVLGRATVELFPTTIALTPDGEFAFVANSDFHGDRPRANVLSVVLTGDMAKLADLPVCDMPHGVKVNGAGTRVYVSCMHSDELLELDPSTFRVSRRVRTGGGHGAGMDHGAAPAAAQASAPTPADRAGDHAGHAGHHAAPAAFPAGVDGRRSCAPTFVAVSADDARLYAACHDAGTLQVWDAATLTLVREVPVGKGAYNVEPSPDGRWLVVTNKKDRSVSVVDAATLAEAARIPTTKGIVHGVAFSPDGRYAYVTAESVGADPGSLDMIDLAARRVVATLPIAAQPTGVTVLPR